MISPGVFFFFLHKDNCLYYKLVVINDTVPNESRVARFVPIHKKGDKTSLL